MTTLTRAGAALLSLSLLVLVLAAPGALAQVPQPSVTVTLDDALELGSSNSTEITGTVAYADTAPAVGGATDGAITLDFTIPDGWSATLDPSSAFNLAPGGSAEFTLTLTAPTLEAGAANAVGDLVVTATAQAPDGRSATGSATTALTVIAPPAIVIPWYQTTGGIALIVGAILLVVVAIVALLLWRRSKRLAAERAAAEAAARAAYLARETGVVVDVAGTPIQYGHKREIMYRVAVTNKSDRPRVAVLDIAETTNGWRAAFQVTKVPLSVGQTQSVTLVVTPDAVITPGDRATVVVRAKPEEALELSEKVTLEVVAPKHGVPADPHYRIVTVHREGANNQFVRR